MTASGSLKHIDAPQQKQPLASYLFTKMQNMRHAHERLAARWLEKRGWCVFYLEECARCCSNQGTCWLGLYESVRNKPSSQI